MRFFLAATVAMLCQVAQAEEPTVFQVPPGYEDIWAGSTIHIDYYDYVVRGDGTMVLADSPIHSMAGIYPHFSAFHKPVLTDSPVYNGGHTPRPYHYKKPRGFLGWTR